MFFLQSTQIAIRQTVLTLHLKLSLNELVGIKPFNISLTGATFLSLPKIPHCCQRDELYYVLLWLFWLSIIGKGYLLLDPST